MNELLFSTSTAYTLYKIHPYIPYRLIWSILLDKLKKEPKDFHGGVECYNIITSVNEYGMVEKSLMFLEEPTFTYLGVEYEDDDYKAQPVFL